MADCLHVSFRADAGRWDWERSLWSSLQRFGPGDFVAIKQVSFENITQEDLNIIMVVYNVFQYHMFSFYILYGDY